jgi:hypothetical protein
MKIRRCLSNTLLLLIGCLTGAEAQSPQGADPERRIWFVQAGANGDGSDPGSPLGSSTQVEEASRPGDIIFLLHAGLPLEHGLALKPRQVLRGLPGDDGAPVLTNAGSRHGGIGLVLADSVRVEQLEIRSTRASGIFGADVHGVEVSDVLITDANTAHLTVPALPDPPLSHGGVTLLGSRAEGAATVALHRVRVLRAAGAGILALAAGGSDVTVDLRDGEIRDGVAVGGSDFGVAAFASGPSSSVALDVLRSAVSGRMGMGGRNVIVAASSGGRARGEVRESYVGASGQDGVIAVAYQLPAEVEVMVVGSTLENAAQSNVEGTMLAFPHDQAAADASRVDVSIHRSTIRGAGRTPGFEGQSNNVLVTGSLLPPDQPLPQGPYRLRITDSEIEGSAGAGLRVGMPPGRDTIDPGQFHALVRGTRFIGNATGDVLIGAPAVEIDARDNCWLSPQGAEGVRVVTASAEWDGAVDTSNPVACRR